MKGKHDRRVLGGKQRDRDRRERNWRLSRGEPPGCSSNRSTTTPPDQTAATTTTTTTRRALDHSPALSLLCATPPARHRPTPSTSRTSSTGRGTHLGRIWLSPDGISPHCSSLHTPALLPSRGCASAIAPRRHTWPCWPVQDTPTVTEAEARHPSLSSLTLVRKRRRN